MSPDHRHRICLFFNYISRSPTSHADLHYCIYILYTCLTCAIKDVKMKQKIYLQLHIAIEISPFFWTLSIYSHTLLELMTIKSATNHT